MRNNKAKDNMPRGFRPVKRIELSEKNFKPRVILAVILLIVGLIAIGYALSGWLNEEAGWVTVEVNSSEPNCKDDFVFTYYVGAGEASATNEKKQISALYSEASVKAYKLFDRYESYEGMANIHYLNTHVNQTVEVDSVLYKAFELFRENGSRYLYLGAIHSEYSNLFFGYEDSPISEDMDPYTNSEIEEYFGKLTEYAEDSEHINLELLGDNRVMLKVSEEYLAFAEENGIEVFIDFFRMKNAFVVDYFADVMMANGFTYGSISSFDGYARNLDNRGNTYALNFFDLYEKELFIAGKMIYSRSASLVSLRSYPMGELDSYWFYESAISGKIIPPYVDYDGLYRSAVNNLTSYSTELGCAEMIVKLMPVFIDEYLDTESLNALCDSGISSIWGKNGVIYYNDETLKFEELYEGGGIKYSKQLINE